jgi:hypothetical protein
MGWETRRNGRRYYYKASKVNGRVVKQYLGAGEFAELLAQMDELDAERRQLKAEEERAAHAELQALDDQVRELNDLVDALTRAVLLLAGYHRHDRGEWRKQREQDL